MCLKWLNNRKPISTIISLVLMIVLVLGLNMSVTAVEDGLIPTLTTTSPTVQPSDIQGNWAASQINDWVNKGLAKGYQDGTFKPANSITRAEFMTLANHAFGFSAAAPDKFSDVSSTDWFAGEVAKARAAGYISGYQDGTVRPNEQISRQEVASMLTRIAKLEITPDNTALNGFEDAGDIPEWSKGAISAVVNKGFMHGYPDQTYQATKNISRAEAIVTLDNAISISAIASIDKTYDKAGIYGPATGVETVNGNATISVAGITLQNIKITGNLTLAEGIGDGDVALKNVAVQGTSVIKGGGAHSVTLENCTLPSITISKDGVRVVASGSTSVNVVQLESGATLVETTSSGPGFETVTISEVVPAGAKVTLTGNFSNVNLEAPKVSLAVTSGTVAKLEVATKATGVSVNFASGVKVETLTLNSAVSFTGKGTIGTSKENVAGTTYEQKPTTVETTTTPASGAGSGTGTGGGGGNNPLSFVSSNPADGSTGVSETPTLKMTFDRGVVRDYWDNNQNCFYVKNNSNQSVSITVSRAGNYTDDTEKSNIYITPNSALTAGMTYTLTASAGLKANNGNTLGTNKTISFTVAGSLGGGGGSSPTVGTLTISDGDGRSELNAKASNGPADDAQSDCNVMTFKLTANAVESIIIPTGNNISISTSNIDGLNQTDLTNIELFTDPNGDGKTNDGTSIAAGTLGTITGGNAAITFNLTTQQTVAASVYMNYILQLDTTANWGDGDTFTFAANSISISGSGANSQRAANVTGFITQRAFVNPTVSAAVPIYQSSEVTTNGDVSIIFSENMESTLAMDGKEGQFTVMVAGVPDLVTDLQLTSTPNKIKLVLTSKVTSGQAVTVKYDKDADVNKQVKASGGGVLESFTNKTVQ